VGQYHNDVLGKKRFGQSFQSHISAPASPVHIKMTSKLSQRSK